MNKIVVRQNKLESYFGDDLVVDNNCITFKKSGEYEILYEGEVNLSYSVRVLEGVMVKLLVFGIDVNLVVNSYYYLEGNSQVIRNQFYCNKMVREKMDVYLDGEKASFSNIFSSICKVSEEYHFRVFHNQNQVSSNILNKCIGLDGSYIDIVVDSILEKGNRDVFMDQTSRILTLGDVDAHIQPNMFIDEDSVEARHGSVISSFREDELFYLMSRGIAIHDATLLLIKGFVLSHLLIDMEKRSLILDCIDAIYK